MLISNSVKFTAPCKTCKRPVKVVVDKNTGNMRTSLLTATESRNLPNIQLQNCYSYCTSEIVGNKVNNNVCKSECDKMFRSSSLMSSDKIQKLGNYQNEYASYGLNPSTNTNSIHRWDNFQPNPSNTYRNLVFNRNPDSMAIIEGPGGKHNQKVNCGRNW